MPIFTGYEPNNLVGKGPGNAPIALGPARTTQTTGSASSSSAPQQLVPADTLEDDFDRLFDESMSELFDGPLVPLADIHVVQSGLQGFAAPIGQDPLVPLADNFVQSGLRGLAAPIGQMLDGSVVSTNAGAARQRM